MEKAIVRIKGGPGNQFFCYAVARRLALGMTLAMLVNQIVLGISRYTLAVAGNGHGGRPVYQRSMFVSMSLLSETETRILIAPKITAAIIGILLNIIGAAWFSASGVVGACAFTSAV